MLQITILMTGRSYTGKEKAKVKVDVQETLEEMNLGTEQVPKPIFYLLLKYDIRPFRPFIRNPLSH